MTSHRLRRRLALLLTALASACAGLNVGDDSGCAESCAVAYTCGFLPSSLGYGLTAEAALADCERRCGASPRDDESVTAILGCLQGTLASPDTPLAWCLDAEDPAHATGEQCAAATACFSYALPDVPLVATVDLEVSMISFADYEALFGAGSVAALYADNTPEVHSCSPALCGPSDCMRRGDDRPCDDSMCRSKETQTVKACDQLQVSALDILVEERGAAIATLELLDETDSTECKEATAVFATETYHLNPGPARVHARFSGELPTAQLELLRVEDETTTGEPGEPGESGESGEPTSKYCLQFVGMSVTLRGGENAALVPIGGVEDIIKYQARPIACDR